MSEFQIEIDPRAVEDIERATAWLQTHAPHKVPEWLNNLEITIASLSTLPFRCPLAPENGRWETQIELRQLLFNHYPSKFRIIFTVVADDTVRVLQVRHGSRMFMHEGDDSETN